MIKRILIYKILLLIIPFQLLFPNKALFNLGKVVSEGAEYFTLLDKRTDIPVTIVNLSGEEINDTVVKRIIYLKDLIEKLKNIKNISGLTFTILLDGTISAAVTSNEFIYQNKIYIGNMINGFSFVLKGNRVDYYSHIITSDNSIINDNGYFTSNAQVITAKGMYRNEEEFLFTLASAVENPSSFLIKDTNQEAGNSKINNNDQNILALRQEVDRLKRIIVLVNNTNVGQNNIDDHNEYINKIIIMKLKNREYTVDEIVKQLKKEKIPIRSKIIYAILRVYFNEDPMPTIKKVP